MARTYFLMAVSLLLISACAVRAPEDPEPEAVPAPEPEDVRQDVIGDLHRQAIQRMQQQQFLPAIALLERALMIKPDEVSTYVLLARVHTLNDDRAQAREMLQRGILYAPAGSAAERQITQLLNSP